jgi:hypothetical protein
VSRYWDIISETWKESGEENVPDPLVIAADQLAEAVEFGKEHGYYDVRKLRTALANYKRVREGK